MIPVFLSCPVRPIEGETKESNLARARRYYRVLSLALPNYAFIAPWILNCEVFPETPEAIELGMERNRFWIDRCAEVWWCGPRVSNGMVEEGAWIKRRSDTVDFRSVVRRLEGSWQLESPNATTRMSMWSRATAMHRTTSLISGR